MAINPMIALQGRVTDANAAIQGGLQTAQQIRQMPIQAALDKQRVQQGQQQLQMGQQGIQQNEQSIQQSRAKLAMQKGATMHQLSREMMTIPLEQRASYLARKMPILQQMGMSREQILSQGLTDKDLQQVAAATQQFAPQADPNAGFTLGEGETRFGPSGEVIAEGRQAPSEADQAIVSETRKELAKTVSSLRDRAGGIKQSYEKLYNLADEMRGGNRSAVSQGLIALVKLGDPTSVVRESEMISALNRQNPVSAVFELLKSSGTTDEVASSVAQRIDPLSPNNVDVDDILATADAIMAPTASEITRAYRIARSRAGDARLSERGIESIFGRETEALFSDLGGIREGIQTKASERTTPATDNQGQPTAPDTIVIRHPELGNITEQAIQDTMRKHGVTREQVIQQIGGGAQ